MSDSWTLTTTCVDVNNKVNMNLPVVLLWLSVSRDSIKESWSDWTENTKWIRINNLWPLEEFYGKTHCRSKDKGLLWNTKKDFNHLYYNYLKHIIPVSSNIIKGSYKNHQEIKEFLREPHWILHSFSLKKHYMNCLCSNTSGSSLCFFTQTQGINIQVVSSLQSITCVFCLQVFQMFLADLQSDL